MSANDNTSGDAGTTDESQPTNEDSAGGHKDDVDFGIPEDSEASSSLDRDEGEDGDPNEELQKGIDEQRKRESVMEVLEGLLEDTDEIELEYAVWKTTRETDLDEDDVESLVDEVAVVEDDKVTGVSRGADLMSGGNVGSWEQVRHLYSCEPGHGTHGYQSKTAINKQARQAAIELLESNYDFIYYVHEDLNEEAFCMRERSDDAPPHYQYGMEGELDRILEDGLGEHYQPHEVRVIKERLQARHRAGYDEVNGRQEDRSLICLKNGVLCVDEDGYDEESGEWELLDHDPDYNFLYCINAEYRPDDTDREFVARWMHSLFAERQKALVFGEIFGSTLVPDQRFKSFALFTGPTNSGNTRAMAALSALHDDNSTSSVELQDLAEDKFAASNLVREGGRMVNIGTDISSKKVTETGLIKQLTSDHDESSVQAKHQTRFDVDLPTSQVYNTNEAFLMPSSNGAIPARLKHLHFDFQFMSGDEYDPDNPRHKEADPYIVEKLTTQERLNAILLEALDGLRRLYENDRNYSYDRSTDERWEEYISMADTVGCFLAECTENDFDTRDVHSGADPIYTKYEWLFEAYKQWCDDNDKDAATKSKFAEYMSQSTTREIIKCRPRIGPDNTQVNCRKGLKFSEIGWAYAPTEAKRRMAAKYDLGPLADEDDDGSSDDESDSGQESGEDLFAKVTSAITQLGNANGAAAKYAMILDRVEDDIDGVDDLDAVLMKGIRKGKFEMTDDGKYRVVTDGQADD